MAVRQITPMKSVTDHIEREIDKGNKVLINAMLYVGESCVAEMRSNYDYIDQTGNLTSSKGYALIIDGSIYRTSSFDVVKGGRDGVMEGEELVRSLTRNFPNGIVLVVAAGMNYATHVSAMGYNVADSAETLAQRLVPQILKQLGFIKR